MVVGDFSWKTFGIKFLATGSEKSVLIKYNLIFCLNKFFEIQELYWLRTCETKRSSKFIQLNIERNKKKNNSLPTQT